MQTHIIFRRILKNIKWFSLNTLGLSIALACVILVYGFISTELSYDKFHSKAERIFRVTQNTNTGESSMIDARVWIGLAEQLKDQFPGIENFVRFSSYRNAMVAINENSFYSRKIYGVDSSFFKVFDFELLQGSKKDLFIQPNEVIITENVAKKYFGTTNVIGKSIKIMHQKQEMPRNYTIKAVIKNFPKNSHIKADMLCTLNKDLDSWAYTYLLLAKGINYKDIEKQIQQKWNEQYAEKENKPLVNLQALSKIHLYSKKSREMEANGNVNALLLLASGALIILLIALINFSNLNHVQFISEQNALAIKKVNGASIANLISDFLKETFILIVSVGLLGGFAAYYIVNNMGSEALFHLQFYNTAILFILFITLISLIAIIPFVLNKNFSNYKTIKTNKNNTYKHFVVLQMALSVFAITLTIFLHKQLNYINNLHPNAQNNNLLLLPNNPKSAIKNYQSFKQQALNHPEITGVSAAMEEPGGIVTDNFPYTLAGENTTQQKTINILTVDENFIDFFNLELIAGSANFGTTPPLSWEEKSMDNWLKGTIDQTTPYSGKYIVNQTSLKHMGINSANEAIGKQFDINFMGNMFPEGEIIGVVKDFHYTNMYVKEKPLVLIPRKLFCHCFLIKINAHKKAQALTTLKSIWENINPEVPFHYEFVTDTYKKVYQNEYLQMRVILVFALIAILLSSLGLFAMVAYSLNKRTKEIGIRKTNGASSASIIKMLIKSYFIWILTAIIIASPLAYFAVNKWLENFAYKTPLNWWVFALSGCLVLVTALLTVGTLTYTSAKRNPIDALRYE